MEKTALLGLLDDYLFNLRSSKKEYSDIEGVIEIVFTKGFDIHSIAFFEKEFDPAEKQEFVSDLFEELDTKDSKRKYRIRNVLNTLLIETSSQIREQIIPVYFNIIGSEKKDFKLVFETIKIFTSRWEEFDDHLKKSIFSNLLRVLDNPIDFFVEEGIYEITKLVLNSKSSLHPQRDLFSKTEMEKYLLKLIKITKNSKKESLYAGLESIKQILDTHPDLIKGSIYELIRPLFRKFLRKIAIFYPAKRIYLKNAISFVKLILLFEKEYSNEIYVQNLIDLMEKMSKKVDHADIKYFLEIILFIVSKTVALPKIRIIQPAFDNLRSLYQKIDRLEEYTAGLINQIMDLIWSDLDEEEKDFFYKESNFNDTVI